MGGPHHRSERDDYAVLPIAVLAWRVRLGLATVTVVFLIAGESVALVFAAAFGLALLVVAGGTAMARLEARIHGLRRQGRRR